MKAAVYHEYGSTNVFNIEEIATPTPAKDEVLVKVKAASINSWDYDMMTGSPKIYRLLFGLKKPKYPVVGSDLAGVVEAIGKNVKKLKPGDSVYGDISENGFGAFAEFACVPERLLSHKPEKMSYAQASALPQAGLLALQGLIHKRKLVPGQQMLINGAGGGAGIIALQLATEFNVTVTVVDKANKLDRLKDLGAIEGIDFETNDFTKTGVKYDFIFDVISKKSLRSYLRALKKGGIYVTVGGRPKTLIALALFGGILKLLTGKRLSMLALKPNKELGLLADYFINGVAIPKIDKVYKLEDFREAMAYFGTGDFFGKIIIEME